VVLRAVADDGATLTLRLRFDGELFRASAPGRPDRAERATFYLVRTRGRAARLIATLETAAGPRVRSLSAAGEVIEVETATSALFNCFLAADEDGEERFMFWREPNGEYVRQDTRTGRKTPGAMLAEVMPPRLGAGSWPSGGRG